MMSADMLITSGSSFTFVAASMSYKPVVLFDRPKEGLYFGVYMDDVSPTVSGLGLGSGVRLGGSMHARALLFKSRR